MIDNEIRIYSIYCESAEKGERLVSELEKYEGIRVAHAEMRIGTQTSTITPSLSTNRGFFQGELAIGYLLMQLRLKE